MQTKNVNMAPLNNCVQEGGGGDVVVHTVAPPLPPRGPAQTSVRLSSAEVEGYGPYKPVPPPKPLPTSGCHSPPPYRMPPYPLYSEPTIPGAATGPESVHTPSQNNNNLHTHSSKFPIEREVILSSTDKNSKIPILNEYRKRPKTAIAPDAPNKQLAWTEEKNKGLDHNAGNHHPHPQDSLPTHQLYKAQPMTLIDTSRESDISPVTRTQDLINGYASQPSVSTGAVPRTPAAHSTPEGDSGQNKAFPTRTYHTIKDMISSRFTKQQRSDMGQKQDELSPQSQLRQHGVYLASAQQQSRAMNPGAAAASAEVMRRNQEIRQQLERGRRGENDDGGFHEMVNRNYHGGSRHSILDSETPRRNPNDTQYQSRETDARVMAGEMTPGGTRRMDTRTPIQPEIRPGEMYGRMPTSQSIYYQDSAGYGIPGTRKSVADAENVRRAAETERVRRIEENRSAFQSVNQQQPPTPHQRMSVNPEMTPRLPNKDDRMQSLGVYVSRNANEQSQTVNKNPDTRTPEFRHRTDFIDKRSVCQSNERLDIVGDSASAVGLSSGGALGHSTNTGGVVVHSGGAGGVAHAEHRPEVYQKPKPMSEPEEGRGKDDCMRPDLDDDDAGFSKGGASSDYEKLRGGAQSDSGRGSTVYSSGKAKTERQIDTSPEPNTTPGPGNSQWVDIVESELRHILDPKLHHNIANSTLSESISSMTPPLPPLSPGGSSDEMGPAFKHKSLPYGSKPEYSVKSRNSAGPGRGMWSARVNSKDKSAHHRSSNKRENLQSKLPPTLLCSSLDLDSMLDDENNSSDEDLSTTIDTSDTRAIRKQLEGLENMYSEVLKLLGVKKQFGRYQPSDPRINKRRLYGSMSSLPSSVSSRPMRDKRRHDERKKVKDIKGINKRFQRLESHVVTLARSVAHLSSEMRTQHLMMQEMEVIRGELAALRTQSNMAAVRSQSMPRALNRLSVEQSNSNPERVKKLTKFFGDEPPLLRLFLKKLGYEKYASLFENERVGLVELPYMTEERLHKLGIPLGPRLRIMQEAQIGFAAHENTLCIV